MIGSCSGSWHTNEVIKHAAVLDWHADVRNRLIACLCAYRLNSRYNNEVFSQLVCFQEVGFYIIN